MKGVYKAWTVVEGVVGCGGGLQELYSSTLAAQSLDTIGTAIQKQWWGKCSQSEDISKKLVTEVCIMQAWHRNDRKVLHDRGLNLLRKKCCSEI